MITLSPDDEKAGWLACEQARAYESLQRKKVPQIYGAIFFLMLIATLAVALTHPHSLLALGSFVVMLIVAALGWQKWVSLGTQHTANLMRLEDLEKKYGPELPWLQVERQMAAVAEIQREIEATKNGERKA